MTEGLQLGTRFYVKYVPQLRFGEAQRERCRLEGGSAWARVLLAVSPRPAKAATVAF